MENNNLITVLAVVLVVLSLAGMAVTVAKASDFRGRITGYEAGYVNITILTTVSISVSPDTIDFGPGAVDAGKASATVISGDNGTSSVTDGNWSTTGAGGYGTSIQIANTGNINVTLDISSSSGNANWLCDGSCTGPEYYLMVSDNETGSCTGGAVGNWIQITNGSAVRYCDEFSAITASNTVDLDAKLVVPYDATNSYAAKSDTLNIVAAAS